MTNDARSTSGLKNDPISRLLGDREPLEVARELFVYAPIGLASRLHKDLPGLIEEGRNKYSLAKVMGTFAALQGRRQFEERLRHFCGESTSTSASSTVRDMENDASQTIVEPDVETPVNADSGPDGHELPIARYDTLSATQVLSHLASLTTQQRAVIAEYERTHRNRRTILNRIEHLDAAQS